MRLRFIAGTAAVACVVLAWSAPLRAQSDEHQDHHPQGAASAQALSSGAMMQRMASSHAKLDALVAKMNAAKGAAKTEAMAELLTALVRDQREMCEPMMTKMTSMMEMMAGARHGDATPKEPAK